MERVEISLNRSLGDLDLTPVIARAQEQFDMVPSATMVSLIVPRYIGVFSAEVQPIITDAVRQAADTAYLSDGTEVSGTSIFGIATFNVSLAEVPTRAFTSFIDARFMHMVDDVPSATHNYHRNMIAQVNAALGALASPYCLEQIPQ